MKIIAQNKKAYFDYFIEDSFLAGIVLVGSEVKSIRAGHCTLADSFVSIRDGEIFIKNMQINRYKQMAVQGEVDEKRIRKLLMNKAEIAKLEQKSNVKGYTIVPTKIGFVDNLIKVEVALARGKHTYDKKEVLKEKDLKKQSQREIAKIK